MESIKGSLSAMTELFNSRMNEFQQELQKTSPAVASTTSLAAEFASFKKLIFSILSTIQSQVEFLGRELDRAEMRGRRKMLLLHGVQEKETEDTSTMVSSFFTDKLKITECTNVAFSRCYRLGRPSGNKPRPIIVKFKEAPLRDKVWFNKTKLKGSGVTVSEFLTKSRHTIFMQARQRFGITKCWTRDGKIHVLAQDGSHHQVESLVELDAIPQTPAVVSPGHPIAAGGKPTSDKLPLRGKKMVKK